MGAMAYTRLHHHRLAQLPTHAHGEGLWPRISMQPAPQIEIPKLSDRCRGLLTAGNRHHILQERVGWGGVGI